MQPLYIIDHSNLVYRFKNTLDYAYVNIKGVRISIAPLVGYIRSLKSNPYKDIAIVLDGIPLESKRILPEYKGQRSADPKEDLGVSRKELIKFLTKLGPLLNKNINVYCTPGQEADQVISSIVHIVSKRVPANYELVSKLKVPDKDWIIDSYSAGGKIEMINDFKKYDVSILCTTDSDMYQLMDVGSVLIDSSTSGKMILNDTPKAVQHLEPKYIPAYKMLLGDVSDNVPHLKLDLDKEFIFKAIYELGSKAQRADFINKCIFNIHDDNPILEKLRINVIVNNQQNLLKIVNRVTELGFYSIPFKLSYPDYDINSTISKFKLRV